MEDPSLEETNFEIESPIEKKQKKNTDFEFEKITFDNKVAKVSIVGAGMITHPVTTHQLATLQEVDEICGKFRVSGLPVIDDDGTLVGIVTKVREGFDPQNHGMIEIQITENLKPEVFSWLNSGDLEHFCFYEWNRDLEILGEP